MFWSFELCKSDGILIFLLKPTKRGRHDVKNKAESQFLTSQVSGIVSLTTPQVLDAIRLIRTMSHALSIFLIFTMQPIHSIFFQHFRRNKTPKNLYVCANAVQPERVCEVAVCESWLSVLFGWAGGGEHGSCLACCLPAGVLVLAVWVSPKPLSPHAELPAPTFT